MPCSTSCMYGNTSCRCMLPHYVPFFARACGPSSTVQLQEGTCVIYLVVAWLVFLLPDNERSYFPNSKSNPF